MSLLIEKRKEFEAKAAELQSLSAKDKLTTDELGAMKELTGTVQTLKGEVETLAAADALNAEIKVSSGIVSQIDQTKGADKAEVTRDGIEFASERGGISEKQWKHINEPSYRADFERYLHSKTGESGLPDIVRKGLVEGADTDGGYLVPPQMVPLIIARKAAPARVHALVSQITATSNKLMWPRDEYNGSDKDIYPNGIRVTNTGEVPTSATVHEVTGPSFGQKVIDINTWMLSKPVSNDLIEDSGVNLVSYLGEAFQVAVGLLKDYQILRGLGNAQGCAGILTFADTTHGVASTETATNDVLASDDIIDLPFRVPEQYLDEASWVMNRSSTGAAVAKMKDSEGRYMFKMGGQNAGLDARTPDQLNGDPIAWSAFMPDIADGALSILYGNLKTYMLAMRAGFSIQVLTGGEDAKKNQATILGRLRMGGDVLQPWGMRLQKIK